MWRFGRRREGLYGSTGSKKQHFGEKKNGAVVRGSQFDKLCYYNIDRQGKDQRRYMQGNAAGASFFEAGLHRLPKLVENINASNTGGTDHLPFDASGCPISVHTGPVEYKPRTHHSNQDTSTAYRMTT